MRISDWSSDVCSSGLVLAVPSLVGLSDGSVHATREVGAFTVALAVGLLVAFWQPARAWGLVPLAGALALVMVGAAALDVADGATSIVRSEEHTSELQSLMRISYAVFCLKKKK